MKVKIIGLGKCGSRITYDFFAYVSNTPPAYELQKRSNSIVMAFLQRRFTFLENIRKRQLDLKLQRQEFIHQLTGSFLIYDPFVLVAVDSDSANNEIIDWIEFINEAGKSLIFPGEHVQFSDHKGGCDYQIISENIAERWTNIPDDILSRDGSDFVVTAFSIGGGTGGGASQTISGKCKEYVFQSERKSKTEQVHFMGIGILPYSDEPYYEHEQSVPDMDEGERYNSGRFFVNLYGKRNQDNPELMMDSLWLFSNDMLRVAYRADQQKEPNLSEINRYVAANLAVVCNASSTETKSGPNFDPSEMNNRLNGYPFISGYGELSPDRSSDSQLRAKEVKNLLQVTLNNPLVSDKGDLLGLSVPVQETSLTEVNRILDEKGNENFRDKLRTYDIQKAPVEFRTANKVVVLYGQPELSHSTRKETLVKDAASTLFKNSEPHFYFYKHKGELDRLLVLIINPFISFIQQSIYYYIDKAWTKGIESDELDDLLNEVVSNKEFKSERVKGVLLQEEHLDSKYPGEAVVKTLEQFSGTPTKLNMEYVINTLRHLHRVIHFKKTRTRRKSPVEPVTTKDKVLRA